MKNAIVSCLVVCCVFSVGMNPNSSFCSCAWWTTTFCSMQGDIALLAEIIDVQSSAVYTVKVLQDMDDILTGDTVTIQGPDGANCISGFYGQIGESYFFDLYELNPMNSRAMYDIVGCSEVSSLSFERDSLFGEIYPEVFAMSYADFIANFKSCQDSTLNMLFRGIIKSAQSGRNVQDLPFKINNFDVYTEENGAFNFKYAAYNLRSDSLAPMIFTANKQSKRGITEEDIELIGKHIRRTKIFTEPAQLIAADVDRSGAITAYDMVLLRKLLLDHIETLPTGESWLFVRPDYDYNAYEELWMPNEANVYRRDFPQTGGLRPVFKVIKLGDVNGSI